MIYADVFDRLPKLKIVFDGLGAHLLGDANLQRNYLGI